MLWGKVMAIIKGPEAGINLSWLKNRNNGNMECYKEEKAGGHGNRGRLCQPGQTWNPEIRGHIRASEQVSNLTSVE